MVLHCGLLTHRLGGQGFASPKFLVRRLAEELTLPAVGNTLVGSLLTVDFLLYETSVEWLLISHRQETPLGRGRGAGD